MKRKKGKFLLVLVALLIVGMLVLTVKYSFYRNASGDSLVHSVESIVEASPAFSTEDLQKIEGNNMDEHIVDFGENHKLFDLTEKDIPKYLYEIYNNSGEIVKSETMVDFPTITYLSTSLLSIEWGAGTGVWLAEYYDINKDLFSDIYQCPLAVQGYKVVYVDYSDDFIDGKLVIRNIFDKTNYYKEFHLDDMSPVTTPVRKVEFINKNELEVYYLAGKDNVEKMEIFRLD